MRFLIPGDSEGSHLFVIFRYVCTYFIIYNIRVVIFLTNYWDLIEKDVVNIKDGEIMGRFDDVEIDTKKGKIIGFYIEEASRFMGMLGKSKARRIKWEEILKIGNDVIIVNVDDDINNRAIKDMLD